VSNRNFQPQGIEMSFWKSNAIILLAIVMGSANAGVNLKNGNFYISYTDIVVPGTGKSLEMTRTYNSKSTEKGWFGFGWGNVFETKLIKSPDGCVVVHEHGAGGKTRFCPKNAVDPKKAAQKIVDAMRQRSTLTGTAEKNLMNRLTSNAELRHVYARKFRVKTNIAKGTVLYSNQRGIQEVQVTDTGYTRKSNDGKKEYFNKDGQLEKIKDKNNYRVEFTYKNKTLYSIKDSFAKQIYVTWYSNGKIKQMWSAKDKIAEFKYEGDDLVYSKDVAGNTYAFEYDNNHNLTKVIYDPKKKKGGKEDSMKIEYEKKTFFISKITDRNGDTTTYKYGANSKNPKDHYWTEVAKKGFNNKEITNKYEYEIKARPDGSRYTYRIMTKINGIKTETIYSECCGLPLKIARGKVVTNFEYNDKGLLTKKNSTRGDYVKIDYDKVHNKISKVENRSGTTSFKYDKKGNLKEANNSSGKAVLLIYNNKGKIQKMVDKDRKTKKTRVLSFKYNSLGKPVEIEMVKVGKIQVAYDNYGEIKRVESKQGHKMALQVTQAFQNLLAIVKPAGVNLNM
jgi:YD repeat-containing protein